jgi:hypothetical protein
MGRDVAQEVLSSNSFLKKNERKKKKEGREGGREEEREGGRQVSKLGVMVHAYSPPHFRRLRQENRGAQPGLRS